MMRLLFCLSLLASVAFAAEHRGRITFRGLPVPGAVVTATAPGGGTLTAATDQQGVYTFADLADGPWTLDAAMLGFAPLRQQVQVAPNAPVTQWEFTMLPLAQMTVTRLATVPNPAPTPVLSKKPPVPPTAEDDEMQQRAADGLLINGSVNNGAASAFGQMAAFGNNRTGGRGLYTGGLGLILGSSLFDARAYSLTGVDTPKPDYNRVTGTLNFGGPLRIPRLFTNGPFFFVSYQWTRNRNATTASALVPDLAQRSAPVISPQAAALLAFYPLPNVTGNSRYNYQVPLVGASHQDSLQTRMNRMLNTRNQVNGQFALQSTRADTTNLFGFTDTNDLLGINANVNWSHRFGQRVFMNLGYQFSRLSSRTTPFFANRFDVSGQAGITGNDRSPANWGPPTLVFSSGIASLTDGKSSLDRNQTHGVSYSTLWNYRSHNFTFGGDYRRQQFNELQQQDPRGTFTFTGNDFASFLQGVPAASSIAFGNADKYFRQSVYDAYATDDWRLRPGLSVNAGLRWEYGAPITELYGRLVNLDTVTGFTAVSPVVARNPIGALTGYRYPDSLVQPTKSGFSPRIGIAWKPASGRAMVVRAGYGIYYDTSVYPTIAARMAQQPPLSKSLSVQNSDATPITLADGFRDAYSGNGNTFGIDPNFRVGYAQNWQASVQRDLPQALQLTLTYLGIKGTHAMQAFLPNTWPAGAVNPCVACPVGFTYFSSGGNSTRNAAQIQVRRRLRGGLAATVQYVYSKSIDNAAVLGGDPLTPNANPKPAANLDVAQNWRDLRAERGLSAFDQRHVLTLTGQYSTGIAAAGRGGLLWKGWTVATQANAGSGLPQTPIYLAPLQGTGVVGVLRPDVTGAALYDAPAGFALNPAAYAAPAAGRWGNAGRRSIQGPSQFTLNASLARTFQMGDRLNLDLRIDATNAFNHVNYTAWNTTINSVQFGLPAAAGPMRSMQTTLRVRF